MVSFEGEGPVLLCRQYHCSFASEVEHFDCPFTYPNNIQNDLKEKAAIKTPQGSFHNDTIIIAHYVHVVKANKTSRVHTKVDRNDLILDFHVWLEKWPARLIR